MMTDEITTETNLPEIGMGATIAVGSDKYAGTITDIDKDGVITVRKDEVTRPTSFGGKPSQEYIYKPNPKGVSFHFKNYSNGWSYVEQNPDTGRWKKQKANYEVNIGVRKEHHEFSY